MYDKYKLILENIKRNYIFWLTIIYISNLLSTKESPAFMTLISLLLAMIIGYIIHRLAHIISLKKLYKKLIKRPIRRKYPRTNKIIKKIYYIHMIFMI